MKLTIQFLLVTFILTCVSFILFMIFNNVTEGELYDLNYQKFSLSEQVSKGLIGFFTFNQPQLKFLKLNFTSKLVDEPTNLAADYIYNPLDQKENIGEEDGKKILKYRIPFINSMIDIDISDEEQLMSVIEHYTHIVGSVFPPFHGFIKIACYIPIINQTEYNDSFSIFRNHLFLVISLIIIVIIFFLVFIFKSGYVIKIEKITKTSEKILPNNEDLFRTMFELSPTGITLIDEKGTIIEVNPSFCATLGYSRKELLSSNISLFSSPFKESEIGKNITEIISGKIKNHVVTNFRKDGTSCTLNIYETAISLPDGKKGILSVSEDFTEKNRSLEKMLTLSHALESIRECVSITDFDNNIIFVNSAFCKTYGYTHEELIGQNINIITSFNKGGKRGELIGLDTTPGGWNSELITVRKDGSEFPIELSTALIKDEKGNPIALISIAVDITEREKVHKELISAKEKAEESDKLKSAFLTNMSHELRTPLNAIIGLSGLMVDTTQDQEGISSLRIILNSGYHLLGLVEDILDITMIESGQIKINYEKVEINSILNEVKDIIQGEKLRENKTEIEIVLNINTEIKDLYLYTDSRKLKQVLINLLKNSLKFTNKGIIEFGFTTIERDQEKYLKFFVKDTGIGIDKKHHDVIFNTFRQIDYTHTREYGGIGIGLSIAKRIVEILGGEIWVESEPGKGSLFSFTVPSFVEKTQSEKKESYSFNDTDNTINGKTILIAEDEDSNFEFLRIFFKNMNIRLLWAKNGIEAIHLCENNPSINLVLMDIKMPLLNGFEATKSIKRIRPELPVIAQSAYAMISEKEEALKAGCDDYLTKPIRIKQLKEMLKKYLG
jgi:PAS domain S-box-containing protein